VAGAADDLRRPAWLERVPTNIDGQPTHRLIFIFRAPGCTYARRPAGGCTMCGFTPLTGRARTITPADLIAQFDHVFGANAKGASPPTPPLPTDLLTDLGEVDLYNSGSFLADEEMPPPVRAHIFRRLAGRGLRRVVVESRPEFVTPVALREAAALPPGVLDVGIGLESADDHIREVLIRKGFDRPAFERAAGVLAETGLGLLVNILLKPPGVLDDRAALADALATGQYVAALARRLRLRARLALQPVFVAPGTALEADFLAGRYQPPSLWTVVEAVRGLHGILETTVGLSDEGLEPHRSPAGCGRCDDALRAALRDYNRTRCLAAFADLACSCRASP
jgi:radical SAM enzyme (TIGR01210 family)